MRRFAKLLAAVTLILAPVAAVTSPAQASARTWSSFDAGLRYACAIKATTHSLYCWGDNSFNQLGDGTGTTRLAPKHIGRTTWSTVSAGYAHTCGIRPTHTLYCWGDNADGLLGFNDTDPHPTPERVGSSHWLSVSVGDPQTCGITTNHKLYCWGDGDRGELGDGIGTAHGAPHRVGTFADWTTVTAGAQSSCGIRKGALYCWGYNAAGQLGVGDFVTRGTPKRVGTRTDWTRISIGSSATACGIRGGHVYCWGENTDGQVGNGTTTDVENAPRRVGSSHDSWSTIASGEYHSCGIGAHHRLYCWGYNGQGELGLGTTTGHTTPQQQPLRHTDWSKVTAGLHFTCALRSNHALYCWGTNEHGQLGIGTADPHLTAQRVV